MDPLTPYQAGQWDLFYDTFLNLVKDYKFALYNLVCICNIRMIPIDSPENKYLSNLIYGKTARIIAKPGNLTMEVFEEFLVENKINAYEFTTLIIHEVMHSALGHMNILNKPEKKSSQELMLDNIIYDAVVNSVICKKYNLQPEFQTMFEKLYKADELPYAFLRPNSQITDPYLKQVYDALYSEDSVSMYELKQAISGSMPEGGTTTIILLGSHGEPQVGEDGKIQATLGEDDSDEPCDNNEDSEDGGNGKDEQDGNQDGEGGNGKSGSDVIIDPEIQSAIAEALKELSESGQKPGTRKAKKGSQGCDPTATTLYEEIVDEFFSEYHHDPTQDIPIVSTPVGLKQTLEKDFLKIRGDRSTRRVFPHHKDRKLALYGAMRVHQPFFKCPLPDMNLYVTAYFDVSGSTDAYHKIFFDSIRYNIDYFDEVYAFSTFVYKCSESDIANNKFQTSGGTNDCWMEHLTNQGNYNRDYGRIAYVFTDGCFNGSFWTNLDVKNTKIIVVYMKDYMTTTYFDQFPEAVYKTYKIHPNGQWDEC
jgi:hypothetical protein